MDYSKIITIEPGKRSGKPRLRGMRIIVQEATRWELPDKVLQFKL